MKHNKQKGFSAVLAIILVAVIAAAALAGWYVWDRNKKPSTNDSNSSQSQEQKGETKSPISIPAGWKQYKNTEAGFSFYYPPGWGDILGPESSRYRFSELSNLRFLVNERSRTANSTEFGDISYIVIDALQKDGKPIISLAPNFSLPRSFDGEDIIRQLDNKKVCIFDEYQPQDYGAEPFADGYIFAAYCGLNSDTYGAFTISTNTMDINKSETKQLKESIARLLNTFETL